MIFGLNKNTIQYSIVHMLAQCIHVALYMPGCLGRQTECCSATKTWFYKGKWLRIFQQFIKLNLQYLKIITFSLNFKLIFGYLTIRHAQPEKKGKKKKNCLQQS